MKAILTFVFLTICINTVYAQRDNIYRIEGDTKDAVGYSYFVNVLMLGDKNHYTLIEQEYNSKKFARKNIPSKFSKTHGKYIIEKDTLKLVDSNGVEVLFFIVDDKHIDRLFNNKDRTNFYWMKVQY